MHLSTHYYVLSLSEGTNNLYECFRDTVIDVHNQSFPVKPSAPIRGRSGDEGRMRALMREVDREFHAHYQQESLGLIVIGENAIQSAFDAVTAHNDAIIGRVAGDYTRTSPRDVGKIVWPVVKEAMSGLVRTAMRDVEVARVTEKVVFGIDAVSQCADEAEGSTLVVEEDYHVRGSLRKANHTTVILGDVDVRESIDDVVDTIIESVLARGGNVVFMKTGLLERRQRIGLILPREKHL